MAFEVRPMTHPRSIGIGYQGFTGNVATPPTMRQRGIGFTPQTASGELTADNPAGAGPSSIFAPIQTPASDVGRKTTLDDVYSFYNQYLGRDPVFGKEVGGAAEGSAPGTGTTGRLGNSFTSVLNQVRGSQEFKDRVSQGLRPTSRNPFTGKTGAPGTLSYAKGGEIDEKVVGTGQETGRRYVIGEAGPERVTPIGPPTEGGMRPPTGPGGHVFDPGAYEGYTIGGINQERMAQLNEFAPDLSDADKEYFATEQADKYGVFFPPLLGGVRDGKNFYFSSGVQRTYEGRVGEAAGKYYTRDPAPEETLDEAAAHRGQTYYQYPGRPTRPTDIMGRGAVPPPVANSGEVGRPVKRGQ